MVKSAKEILRLTEAEESQWICQKCADSQSDTVAPLLRTTLQKADI